MSRTRPAPLVPRRQRASRAIGRAPIGGNAANLAKILVGRGGSVRVRGACLGEHIDVRRCSVTESRCSEVGDFELFLMQHLVGYHVDRRLDDLTHTL